jgi:hypothetical protein
MSDKTDKIVSASGQFEVRIQNDGNVVASDNGVPYWASHTVRPVNVVPAPLPPGPAPIPPPTGIVRIENGAMVDDRGPFNALVASLFWALWGYKFDRERLEQNLVTLRPGQFEAVRIFGQVGESPQDAAWGDRYIDPDWPDFASVLQGTLDLCATHGMRVALCIFASIKKFATDAACDRFIDKVVDAVRGREHLILYWEIANEGYGTGSNREQLRRLCRYLRSKVSGLVAITSAQAGVETCHLYADNIANFATEHFERDVNAADGHWRPVRQPWGWPGEYDGAWEKEYPGTPAPRLPKCSNNEPIGPYSSIATEHDPLHLIAAAAVSYIAGCPSYVYHCGPGIYGGGAWGARLARPANFWDVPGLTETLKGYAVLRDLLPQGISGWGRQNHGWTNYPWTMVTQAGTEGDGCVRAYATDNGSQIVCVPFGIRDHVQLAQRRAMTWRVHSLLDGRLLREGMGDLRVYQRDGDAQLIVGRFV